MLWVICHNNFNNHFNNSHKYLETYLVLFLVMKVKVNKEEELIIHLINNKILIPDINSNIKVIVNHNKNKIDHNLEIRNGILIRNRILK